MNINPIPHFLHHSTHRIIVILLRCVMIVLIQVENALHPVVKISMIRKRDRDRIDHCIASTTNHRICVRLHLRRFIGHCWECQHSAHAALMISISTSHQLSSSPLRDKTSQITETNDHNLVVYLDSVHPPLHYRCLMDHLECITIVRDATKP